MNPLRIYESTEGIVIRRFINTTGNDMKAHCTRKADPGELCGCCALLGMSIQEFYRFVWFIAELPLMADPVARAKSHGFTYEWLP